MILALLIMGGLALLIGFGLVYASHRLQETPDPTYERVAGTLPNVNCGGCGFAGCKEYAKAVIKNPSLIGRCGPGGKEVSEKLSTILHHKPPTEKRFAVIRCKGGDNCNDRAEYHGISTCEAAVMVSNGQKECSAGCLGFGDCVRACPFNAMHMGTKNYPIVDVKACKSCGKCVIACPRHIPTIRIKKEKIKFITVDCLSHDPGRKVTRICSQGCIACGACEKACPKKAIQIKDNLAEIDYKKCIGCGKCMNVCPKGVITEVNIEQETMS